MLATDERSRSESGSGSKETKVSWLGRAGLITRGLLHLVVGYLAIRVAMGEGGRRADKTGALTTLVRQPFGRAVVLVLAIGFLGYAVWRFVEAWQNPEDDEWWKRAARVARGALYLVFFWSAMRLVVGGASATASEGRPAEQDITATVLGWPFGRAIVAVAGLVLIGMGLWNGWQAVSRKFEDDLKRYEMSDGARRWTTRLGVVGLLARMAAYILCGIFLVRAAWRFDPEKGVGLDAALHELAGASYGPLALWVVGLGLVAFGVYQFVLARYREILGR